MERCKIVVHCLQLFSFIRKDFYEKLTVTTVATPRGGGIIPKKITVMSGGSIPANMVNLRTIRRVNLTCREEREQSRCLPAPASCHHRAASSAWECAATAFRKPPRREEREQSRYLPAAALCRRPTASSTGERAATALLPSPRCEEREHLRRLPATAAPQGAPHC